MAMLASSLKTIVAATWVNSQEKEVVQSLVQAAVQAYESKGASIIETLQDMQSKAEASLSDARKTEMEQKHAFQMLQQSLQTDLKQMNSRMSDASAEPHERAGA